MTAPYHPGYFEYLAAMDRRQIEREREREVPETNKGRRLILEAREFAMKQRRKGKRK